MIQLIAHRGNDGTGLVANSKAALLTSMEKDYIAGIELDVRLTKDKKVVVFHNFLIDDTKHRIRKISSLTFKEIQAYRIGKKEKEQVPLLESVLACISSNKKILIEIKEESSDYQDILDAVYQVIKQYPELTIYICSFHYELLKAFQRQHPNYRVGLIIGFMINMDHLNHPFDFTSIPMSMIDHWDFRKETFVWTVNNPSDIKKLYQKTTRANVITDEAYALNDVIKNSISALPDSHH